MSLSIKAKFTENVILHREYVVYLLNSEVDRLGQSIPWFDFDCAPRGVYKNKASKDPRENPCENP